MSFGPIDTRFRATVGVGALLIFAGGLYLRFGYEPDLPPRPPRPRTSDLATFRALDYSSNVYRAAVERDATLLGVPADPLTEVFPYEISEPRRVLEPGAVLETRNLLISTRVERKPARVEGGTMVSDHLILRIENRTDAYLAYHVVTRVPIDPRGCVAKADLTHNAIALAPRETLERTECGRNGVSSLTVERVETLEIPALSYHYVSRIHPMHIGLDGRAARGHQAPTGTVCGDIPEQAILRGLEKSEVSFRDVIDFHARHNCQSYIFPVGYRAFTRAGERPLPVKHGKEPGRP